MLSGSVHSRTAAARMLVIGALLWGGGAGAGQGSEPRSGDDFRRQLLSPASVTWTQSPLQPALQGLGEQWRIAFFLDRRVDPDQPVDYSSRPGATLHDLLQGLGKHLRLGVTYVDSVVYVGPPETAAVLATLAEEHYDAAQRQRASFLTRRAAMSWPDFSEAHALIAGQLHEAGGITGENLDELPYDVWPAADWPALPLTHRLSLLLAGFDRTFAWDGDARTLRLVPLPREATLVRDYGVRGDVRRMIADLQRDYPQAKLEAVGNRVRVSGSAEDHFWIRRVTQGLPSLAPRRDVPPDVRYSLRTAAKFDGLARALAQRLELTLEIDPQLDPKKLEATVTLEVKDATRDQLLQALADTIGAAFEVADGKLVIRAK